MKNIASVILFSFISLFFTACHQPNPHPETLDPIYSDLEKDKKDLEGRISAEEKHVLEFESALKEVRPQTGQIKYAQKRLSETTEKLEKLLQMKKYYELRLNSRLSDIRVSYLRAFDKNEPWPDPKEYQVYKSQRLLETAPKTWSARDRLQKFSTPKKPTSGGHGEEVEEGHH